MAWKIGHYTVVSLMGPPRNKLITTTKGFKVAILAQFLTDFLTLNYGLICQTFGMAAT
jgi:hypothetical protein